MPWNQNAEMNQHHTGTPTCVHLSLNRQAFQQMRSCREEARAVQLRWDACV